MPRSSWSCSSSRCVCQDKKWKNGTVMETMGRFFIMIFYHLGEHHLMKVYDAVWRTPTRHNIHIKTCFTIWEFPISQTKQSSNNVINLNVWIMLQIPTTVIKVVKKFLLYKKKLCVANLHSFFFPLLDKTSSLSVSYYHTIECLLIILCNQIGVLIL